MFRIGEFARLSGVSARTLRAWDELGLFRPAWVDPATGYRAYSPAQIPSLRRIVALRDLGVPLGDLVALSADGDDLRSVLARRRRTLMRERREIARRLRALDISVSLADAEAGAPGPDVVVRPIPPEAVAVLRVAADGDLNAAFYALESVIRDLGRRAAGPPGAILQPSRGGEPPHQDVYVPVTGRPRGATPDAQVRWLDLPAVTAATLIHHGPYAGLATARDALERWLVGAGRATTGRLRVVYLQFGAEPELRVPPAFLVRRDEDLVTELQLELVRAGGRCALTTSAGSGTVHG